MDDSARVNRLQSRKHRERDVDTLRQRNRPAGEPCRQRFALEQLHGNEQLAVGFADFVKLTHVGMRHAGRCARLAPEALTRQLIAGATHHLEGDATLEPFVGRGVDHAHAAFAELGHHAIVSNCVGHVVVKRFYTARVQHCRPCGCRAIASRILVGGRSLARTPFRHGKI